MPVFLTFDSNEVCELVGIRPLLLNKFVERKTYGIQPSVRRGKGRGGRRLFGPDDVFGIALVWWLFESGLRSGVIEIVLNQICRPAKGDACEAAKKLRRHKTYVLRVRTKPRRRASQVHEGKDMLRYSVELMTHEQFTAPYTRFGVAIELEIHVGDYFYELREEMKKLTGLPEGE